LIIGAFVCFFGGVLFKPVYVICTAALVVFVALVISYNTFLLNNNKTWVGWLVIIISALLGIGIGLLASIQI